MLHEKIIVVAYFDGDSRFDGDHAPPPLRAIYLGSTEVAIKPGKAARFSGIQFSESDYQRLKNGHYNVTINAYPNHREQMKNTLRCTTLSGLSAEFDGRTRTIKCRLMNEWRESEWRESESPQDHSHSHHDHIPAMVAPELDANMATAIIEYDAASWPRA